MDAPVADAVLTVAARASDELVAAVYRRLRADQVAERRARSRAASPVKSWRQLARMAVAEGVLTAQEARWLRIMQAGSAPGARTHQKSWSN